METKHSYAAKVLRDRKLRLYIGGKEILKQDYHWAYPPLITKIIKEVDYKREYVSGNNLSLRDLDEISSLGFKIVKYKTSGTNFAHQRLGYELVRLHHPSQETVATMPTYHYVEYDVLNGCVRLVGKNAKSIAGTGVGEWNPIKDNVQRGQPEYDRNPFNVSYSLQRADRYLSKCNPLIKLESYFEIPEVVIGVTEEGYICAIPRPRGTDMPFVQIIGRRGQGKSMLEDNLECGYHNPKKFNVACCNVNDIHPETQTRCLPWEGKTSQFYNELLKFGEPSVPIPAVYLNPTTKTEYSKIYPDEVGFDVSLPYRHIMKDERLVMYNQAWEMKKGGTHLKWKEMIWHEGRIRSSGSDLLDAKSLVDAKRAVERQIGDAGMKDKMFRILEDIFNSQMIDMASGTPSRWVLKSGLSQFAMSPWNACMQAGLFPYINTSGIRDEMWFALWLRYVLTDILDFARIQKIPTMVFMDEIAKIVKEKATREIIEKAIRECRKFGVGMCIVSHFFGDVPEAISMHSDYDFVFSTKDEKLISHFKKQKGLSARQAAEIPNLKQFQCYAFGDFRLYDTDGNVTSNEGKPIKIVKIKPPNCRHYGGGQVAA